MLPFGVVCVVLLGFVDLTLAENIQSQVVDLNDKFLQVKDSGLWFVAFFAPWCSHCKHLMPIWEHVGHALADRNSAVRVAKLDCTRYPSVASMLKISGYPTIIFFREGLQIIYNGEKKKEPMLDFAVKTSGPIIGEIKSHVDLSEIRKGTKEPFFIYVGSNFEDELYGEYSFVASQLFSHSRFYRMAPSLVPQSIVLPSDSSVIVFKDNSYSLFDTNIGMNLSEWLQAERWSIMPLVQSTNIRDIGQTRLLVLAVLNLVERNNESTEVGRFHTMMRRTAFAARGIHELRKRYQFGWLDGSEIANNIVLGDMPQPNYLVFNVSSYEYYISGDNPSVITDKSVLSFLERIVGGDVPPLGGRSFCQRVKRIVYEVTTNLYEMFRAQPLLTSCLFGVPLAFLSIITYSICSSDFSVDREEIYPEDESDITDSDDHEKLD
ncbi:hypothetical protein AB6A40_006666 [Gnathostoma spinigerum]|uniref:Thioredoxin domain-containing protein n=1 Tax=Gnathostoma spinigerum TaxID=75299 RepID=A0ABD6ETT3_9BILA